MSATRAFSRIIVCYELKDRQAYRKTRLVEYGLSKLENVC